MSKVLLIAFAVQLYAAAYLVAAVTAARAVHLVVAPWHARVVFRESLGCLLRWATSKPTFTVQEPIQSWFQSLNLDLGRASEEDVLRALSERAVLLNRHPWAYPASQQEVLVKMGVQAVTLVRKLNSIKDSARRQSSSSWRTSSPVRVARPDWRQVLGVTASESDPRAIRKAYGRLVSKDHPDKGGTGQNMPRYTQALDAARAELGFV